ncbi:MAG: hypothetical protein P4L16_03800 [Chlamydiales bacterium]|nr:hypothetical protein [Chlamydiales bacterium]
MEENDCNARLHTGFADLRVALQKDFTLSPEASTPEVSSSATPAKDQIDSLAYVLRYVILESSKAADAGLFSLEDVMQKALDYPVECKHCGAIHLDSSKVSN